MNKSQAAAVAVIRETLLLLPWAERAEVFKAVELIFFLAIGMK
jgi:hypothetical protein